MPVQTRFFPDTNILLGLILREQRFWSSNQLFSLLVERHKKECTILPSIESEFHYKLDETIDMVDDLTNTFVSNISLRKTDFQDPMKLTNISTSDVTNVEDSFGATFRTIFSVPDPEEQRKLKIAYDLVEAWIMDYWSQLLIENTQIQLDDFIDSLRHRISEGRRDLEDLFTSLKLRLNHVECTWSYTRTMYDGIGSFLSDVDDVKHLATVASCPDLKTIRAIYVTNDSGVLKSRDELERRFGVIVTRPAFAYARSL